MWGPARGRARSFKLTKRPQRTKKESKSAIPKKRRTIAETKAAAAARRSWYPSIDRARTVVGNQQRKNQAEKHDRTFQTETSVR
jgi:hypothetical protein